YQYETPDYRLLKLYFLHIAYTGLFKEDSRITNFVFNTLVWGTNGLSLLVNCSKNNLVAVTPISNPGCATEVKEGSTIDDICQSLKPTTAMSVGIFRPLSLMAFIAPIAPISLLTNIASGGLGRSRSCWAAR